MASSQRRTRAGSHPPDNDNPVPSSNPLPSQPATPSLRHTKKPRLEAPTDAICAPAGGPGPNTADNVNKKDDGGEPVRDAGGYKVGSGKEEFADDGCSGIFRDYRAFFIQEASNATAMFRAGGGTVCPRPDLRHVNLVIAPYPSAGRDVVIAIDRSTTDDLKAMCHRGTFNFENLLRNMANVTGDVSRGEYRRVKPMVGEGWVEESVARGTSERQRPSMKKDRRDTFDGWLIRGTYAPARDTRQPVTIKGSASLEDSQPPALQDRIGSGSASRPTGVDEGGGKEGSGQEGGGKEGEKVENSHIKSRINQWLIDKFEPPLEHTASVEGGELNESKEEASGLDRGLDALRTMSPRSKGRLVQTMTSKRWPAPSTVPSSGHRASPNPPALTSARDVHPPLLSLERGTTHTADLYDGFGASSARVCSPKLGQGHLRETPFVPRITRAAGVASTGAPGKAAASKPRHSVFTAAHGTVPLTFHICDGKPFVRLTSELVKAGGGLITARDLATFVVLPLAQGERAIDPQQVRIIQDCQSRPGSMAISLDYLSDCIAETELLPPTKYLVHAAEQFDGIPPASPSPTDSGQLRDDPSAPASSIAAGVQTGATLSPRPTNILRETHDGQTVSSRDTEHPTGLVTQTLSWSAISTSIQSSQTSPRALHSASRPLPSDAHGALKKLSVLTDGATSAQDILKSVPSSTPSRQPTSPSRSRQFRQCSYWRRGRGLEGPANGQAVDATDGLAATCLPGATRGRLSQIPALQEAQPGKAHHPTRQTHLIRIPTPHTQSKSGWEIEKQSARERAATPATLEENGVWEDPIGIYDLSEADSQSSSTISASIKASIKWQLDQGVEAASATADIGFTRPGETSGRARTANMGTKADSASQTKPKKGEQAKDIGDQTKARNLLQRADKTALVKILKVLRTWDEASSLSALEKVDKDIERTAQITGREIKSIVKTYTALIEANTDSQSFMLYKTLWRSNDVHHTDGAQEEAESERAAVFIVR
ncbi:hypothetical protein IAT38_005809 [Cryptococcus sp. DSM 104549]